MGRVEFPGVGVEGVKAPKDRLNPQSFVYPQPHRVYFRLRLVVCM